MRIYKKTILLIILYTIKRYFSFNNKGEKLIKESHFSKSATWPILYHFGSIVIGSLLLAIVKLIRQMAE